MIKDSKSVLGGIDPSKVIAEFDEWLAIRKDPQLASDKTVAAEDDCWAAIKKDPQLDRARARISAHEIRLIIKHARAGLKGT